MTGRARLRPALLFGLVAAAVLVAFGFIVTLAPSHVVRYLLGSELDALGIQYDGLETLEIRPWSRELRLGPVRFGQQPSAPGRVGDLELMLRVNPLLKRRISIERLVISGIEILVQWGADEALTLNGIAFDDLLAGATETAELDAKSGFWTGGVDAFELRSSKLIFERSDGGALDVEVERLAMTDFRAWDSEQPGHFELAARVNGIQLNWAGEARPFSDNITLSIDSRTEEAELSKVIRFTGPLGLDRREGSYDARLNYQVTIDDSGGLSGQTVGTIDISGVDYARSGVFALALDKARVELDLQFTSSEAGDRRLRGNLAVDVGLTSAALGDRTRLSAQGTLAAQAIDAALSRAGTLDVSIQPDINLHDLSLSGPLDISVDPLLDLLVRLQSLSATRTLSAADTGLGDLTGKAIRVPDSDVNIDRLVARGERLELRSEAGSATLELNTRIGLDGVEIAAKQRSISVTQAQGAIERLLVTSGDGLLRVESSASSTLTAGKARGPRGEMAIDGLEARVDDLDLEARASALSLQLSGGGTGDAFEGLAYAAGGRPQVQLTSGSLSAALARSSLDVKRDGLAWQATGNAAADAVAVSFADGELGSLKVTRVEIGALRAASPLRLAADTLTIAGLDLSMTRSLLLALAQSGSATTEASVASPVPPVATPVKPRSTPSPADDDAPQPKVDMRRVQSLLTELGYDPGPIDGLMGRRTASAIRRFQTAEGLSADGHIEAGLVFALERRAAPSAQIESGPSFQAGASRLATAEWRLGRLSLPGNPVVHFRDDLVSPDVVVDARFSRLEAQDLDSADPGQRALLDAAAEINERTQLTVSGWIAGLPIPADLELQAELADLQLANYSPYAAALAGVHLDGGRLDAATEVKGAAGNLQGELRLNVDQIGFQSVDEADVQRVGGTSGVPLQTAVDLLVDADGRIALTLPITGTVASPDIDIGPAVTQAIGGVLKTVFPPTLVASMLADLTKGSAPVLDAIEFAPGSATLTQAHRRYADDVAKLAEQHPRLSLKVCGRATAKDVKALALKNQPARRDIGDGQPPEAKSSPTSVALAAADEQALHELAVERQRILTRYLIERGGIDPARVSECRSTFDPNDQGSPRAEVLF